MLNEYFGHRDRSDLITDNVTTLIKMFAAKMCFLVTITVRQKKPGPLWRGTV